MLAKLNKWTYCFVLIDDKKEYYQENIESIRKKRRERYQRKKLEKEENQKAHPEGWA